MCKCVPVIARNRLVVIPVCLVQMIAGILSCYRWRACLPAVAEPQ